MASNFSPMEGAMGLQDPEHHHHPSSHDLNWLSNPPSSSFSLFSHQRRMHGGGSVGDRHAGLNQLLDDSGSNSDENPDQHTSSPMGFLRYLPPVPRRLHEDSDHEPRRMDLNTDTDDESDGELEEILDRHHQQSHDVGAGSSVGVAESVLDSLEIRRHWNFLNRGSGRGLGEGGGARERDVENAGRESPKDEEEENGEH